MKKETIHEILTLADKGYKSSKIARKVKTHRDKVYYICSKHGFCFEKRYNKKRALQELCIGYELFSE
jgi:transcriptional regulator